MTPRARIAALVASIAVGLVAGLVLVGQLFPPTASELAPSGTPATPGAAGVTPTVAPVAAASAKASSTPGVPAPPTSGPAPTVRKAYDPALNAPPLELTDQHGTRFDLASLRGSDVLVYFGFTHCPDVCPTTLGTLREVVRARPDARVVFVTVDPERDTAEALGVYLAYFAQGWIGLTGTDAEVKAAADGYGVRYQKLDYGSEAGYFVAHTSEVYLVDRAGTLRYRYPFGVNEDEIVADLNRLDGG